MLGTAIAASWLTRILTIRSRVRQEKAGAAKAETEVRADQIDNIERLVEKAYKPTIETLENRVKLIDSYLISKKKMGRELQSIRNLHPACPLWQRSDCSLKREWASHNLTYDLGIRRAEQDQGLRPGV